MLTILFDGIAYGMLLFVLAVGLAVTLGLMNFVVAESTGNHFFSDLLRHLGRAIIPRTRLDSSAAARQERGDYVRAVNREHQDIFRAIARSDSDAARAAMRTHLANSRERLRLLKGDPSGH